MSYRYTPSFSMIRPAMFSIGKRDMSIACFGPAGSAASTRCTSRCRSCSREFDHVAFLADAMVLSPEHSGFQEACSLLAAPDLASADGQGIPQSA
jgi:hypothetical protein